MLLHTRTDSKVFDTIGITHSYDQGTFRIMVSINWYASEFVTGEYQVWSVGSITSLESNTSIDIVQLDEITGTYTTLEEAQHAFDAGTIRTFSTIRTIQVEVDSKGMIING